MPYMEKYSFFSELCLCEQTCRQRNCSFHLTFIINGLHDNDRNGPQPGGVRELCLIFFCLLCAASKDMEYFNLWRYAAVSPLIGSITSRPQCVSNVCCVRRKLWTNPTFLQPAEIIFWEWNTLLEPCNHSTAACDKKVTRTLKKYSPFLDKWAMMFCKRASVQMLHFYLILSYLFIFITLYVSAVSSPQKSNNCGQGWFNIWHNTMVHVVCSWVKLIYNSEQIQQTLLMFLISVDQEQYVYKWWSHSHPIHSACRKQIWEPV